MKRIVAFLVAGLLLAAPGYGKDLEKKELKLGEKLERALDKCGGDPVCEDAAVQKYESKLAKLGICPASTSGSILVVPSVAAGAALDTAVELRNASNQLISALCFYADAACNTRDFQVWLPLQTSLRWTVSVGDASAGIPPVPVLPFAGELVCIEIDAAGIPIAGNHLEATGHYTGGGNACLNPISIQGFDTNNTDSTLCLADDFAISDACWTGPEYTGCPAEIDPARIEGCWSQALVLPYGDPVQFLCGPFS